MKRRAYAKQRDSNEAGIVAALRAVGATVERLDVVDLLVGYQGVNYLLEVKTESGAKRKGETADRQRKWQKAWQGNVTVVKDATQALWFIGCPAWQKRGIEAIGVKARRTG